MTERQNGSATDRHEWLIRRGDQEFRAPDLATVRAWYSEGLLAGTDHVFHPSLGNEWRTVPEAMGQPQPAQLEQPRSRSSNPLRLWAIPLIGCGALIIGAFLIGGLSVLRDGIRKATAGPPPLVVVAEDTTDVPTFWNYSVTVVNVSNTPLTDITLRAVRNLDGDNIGTAEGTSEGVIQPGGIATITAAGEIEKDYVYVSDLNYEAYLELVGLEPTDLAYMTEYERDRVHENWMKALGAGRKATRLRQHQRAEATVGFTLLNGSGDEVAFKREDDPSVTPEERQIIDGAVEAARRAAFAEQAREEAERHKKALEKRAVDDAEKETRRQEQQRAAWERSLVALRSISNEDALATMRAWKSRFPAEEARWRQGLAAQLDQHIMTMKAEFGLSEAQVRDELDPIREEVLARWDAGVTQATSGKSASGPASY